MGFIFMSYQERIPHKVYRLSLLAKEQDQLDLVEGILLTLGFPAQEIVSTQEKHQWQIALFREEPRELRRAIRLINQLNIKHVSASLTLLKPDDWASKWKRGWKPAKLTRLLDVVPLWHQDKYKKIKGRGFILMDTLMSFGTGLHETTRIVAQFIEQYRGQIHSFLDIGTGTGVLTLVALKHGARDVLAIDIGELSVEAARKNSKLNKLPFKVLLQDIASFKHDKTYDMVVANLITHDLVSFRRQIMRFVKKGGLLIVSGISLDNWPKFEQGFITKSLKVLKVKKGKQWAGVLCQRI